MFWKKQKIQNLEFLSPDKIRMLIEDLQLPQIIMDFFNGTCNDERVIRLLGDQYQAPYCLLDIPLNNAIEHYKVDRYMPFLASWQDIIFAYDLIERGFVRYGIELFKEKNLQLMTWDRLLLDEIIQLWELETPYADILYLGNLLKLKNTEILIEQIAKGQKQFSLGNE